MIVLVTCLLSLLTIVNSQFTEEKLPQLHALACDQPSITLHVFSGTADPTWTINGKQLSKIKALTNQTLRRAANGAVFHRHTSRVMGYHGFTIRCSPENSVFIHGIFPLEQMLLRAGRRYLQASVTRHVKEHLGDVVSGITENSTNNADCNSVPIKGPDTVPKYDPNSDDSGCFVKKQSENNCYAYGKKGQRGSIRQWRSFLGTDIVTNSFPQPGENEKTSSCHSDLR